MSNRFLDYLKREHQHLEDQIADLSRCLQPDELAISRLKKQKLLIKDQISKWNVDLVEAAN